VRAADPVEIFGNGGVGALEGGVRILTEGKVTGDADRLKRWEGRLPDVYSQSSHVDAAGQRAADGAFALIADDETVQQVIVERMRFRSHRIHIENVGLVLIGEVVFRIENAVEVELSLIHIWPQAMSRCTSDGPTRRRSESPLMRNFMALASRREAGPRLCFRCYSRGEDVYKRQT